MVRSSNETDRSWALVTGASRGLGRGIAEALRQAGYGVFATGRTIATAALSTDIRRIPCDHLDDGQTRAAFEVVEREAGRLDILVNNAWGGYEHMVEDGRFSWSDPFWKQPLRRWTAMMDAGVRAAFVSSACAAPLMIQRRRGLIVNISFWAAQRPLGNALYGMAKAATDKMTADCAGELARFGVTMISLYPGLVRTEAVLEAARKGAFDLANSESPEFAGRVIAALAENPQLIEHSGSVIVAADMARRLGIRDIDDFSPAPLEVDRI